LGSPVVLPTVAFADDSAVAKSDKSQSQTEEKRKTLLPPVQFSIRKQL
jgi:hypothetical protein